MSDKDLSLSSTRRHDVAVTLLRERLSQIGRKASEGDARGRENFNTLARWFYYAIKKPQLAESDDSSSGSDEDSDDNIHPDDEYEDLLGMNDNSDEDDLMRDDLERRDIPASSSVVESRVSEALEDLKHGTKLSVAVTGSRGVGKSLLLNTLLEATTRDSYQHENASISSTDDSGATEPTPYAPKTSLASTGYDFASSEPSDSAKDDMDVDWWSGEGEKPKSVIKPYKRYTSYSFESPVTASAPDHSFEGSESSSSTQHRGFRAAQLYASDSTRSISSMQSSSLSPQEDRNGDWMMTDSGSSPTTPRKNRKNRTSITYKNMTGYTFNNSDKDAARRANRRGGNLRDSRQRERRRQHARDQELYATSDVGDITKHFVPDAKFLASIDWDKEKNLPGAYFQLLTSELNLDDARSFLLPQGNHGGGPQLLALRYGDIPELIVCFPTENEIRLALWELHDIFSGQKRVISEDHINLLQARYRRLLNLGDEIQLPLPNIGTPHELPLGVELINLLGKNFRFVGLGKSLDADRIYIREKMKEIVKHYGLHMVRMIVRLPSTLLEGNRELVEVSGTYSQDLRTKRALEGSDLVMITVDRLRGLSADIAALLGESGIVQKLASAPDLHKAIFVELSERKHLAMPRSEDAVDALIASNDQEFDVFKQQLLHQWRHILQHSLTSPPQIADSQASPTPSTTSLASHMEPIALDRLAARAEVVPAKPLLFADLHMRDLSAPLEEIASSLNMDPDSTSLREVLASTAIPSLISAVPNQAISKMSRALSEMSSSMMQAFPTAPLLSSDVIPDENQSPQPRKFHTVRRPGENPGLLGRCRAVDQCINSFGVSMASWKQDRSSSLKQLEVALSSMAARSVEATRQHFGLLAAGHQHGVQQEAIAFIKDSTIRPLVDAAASLWRQMGEAIPGEIEVRLQIINSMLHECSTLIEMKFAQQMNADQPRRLQEFIKSIQESALKQMTQFRDTIAVLDPISIIKDATMRVLQQHVLPERGDNPNAVSFELRNIAEFPGHAVAAIVAKIVQVVQMAQTHLDAMQRDVLMAVRSVVIAVRSNSATPTLSSDQVSQFNSFDTMEGIQKTIAAAAFVDPQAGPVQTTLPPSATAAAASVTLSSTKPWMVISGMHSVVPQSHAALLFDGTRWDRLDLTSKAQARVNFDKQLQQSGLKVFDVDGDAASQFRALSHQIYGSVETHAIVRMLVCSEILNHPHYYERMVTHLRGVDIQEYVQILSLDSCRGDHVSLCAFANLFGADLMLYSPAFQHPVHIQARTRHILANGEHRVFSVALLPDDRYASLVSIQKLNSHSPLVSNQLRNVESRKSSEFDTASDAEDLSTDSVGSRSSSSRRRKRSDSDESVLSLVGKTKSVDAASPASAKRSKLDPSAMLQNASTSLIQLCIMSIVENIDLYPPLEGAVPDELLSRVLAGLCSTKRLNDDTFARVLDSNMRAIKIEGPCPSLTDASLVAIAKKCGRRLRHATFLGCISISNRGLISMAECCTELESISLRGCVGISNMAIQEIARRCRNLSQIDLSGCTQVTDIAVQELLLACPNIRVLLLQNCPQLGDNAFSYFPKTLQLLDIHESEQITDKSVINAARKAGASLEILRISGRNLSDSAAEEIARQCPQLQTLEIANGDHLTEASMSQILIRCPLLKSLSLPACRGLGDAAFNSAMLDGPAFPVGLESLNLSLCFKISDSTLRAIARCCKSLKSISLAGCEEVTDEGFTELAVNCKQLRQIDLTKCSKLTEASVRAIAASCLYLQRVGLANCNLISTESIIELASRCRKLVDVDLSGCDNLTDAALEKLAVAKKLRYISVSDCSKISTAGIAHLSSCSRLQRLRLAGSKSLTDSTLLLLARSCSALVDLDLSHCTGLTVPALQEALPLWQRLTRLNLRGITLGQSEKEDDSMDTDNNTSFLRIIHPILEDLNISWCKQVDDRLISTLAAGCPSLVSLDVAWCSQITANGISHLTQHCPNLRTLNLRGCTRVGMLNYISDNPLVIYR